MSRDYLVEIVKSIEDRLTRLERKQSTDAEDLFSVNKVLTEHLQRLESAAREPAGAHRPSSLCVCGHPWHEHVYHSQSGSTNACDMLGCRCESFITAPEPHGEAVDPVLFHICQAYRLLNGEGSVSVALRLAYRHQAVDGKGKAFVHDDMIAYGVNDG